MQDAGGYEPAFESWLRQRGKALYTEDGKLGFDEKDVADWFAFWARPAQAQGLRRRPDVQALDQRRRSRPAC